ncbi:MAG: beta-lactamase family protein [Planctomycetes bacterium]|nr:beta-lactamase family protein [Planctomycetota bacterium]
MNNCTFPFAGSRTAEPGATASPSRGQAIRRALSIAGPAMLALQLAISASAQAVKRVRRPHDLSPLLERVRQKSDLPGVGAVVVQGQRIVAEGAAGVRRLGGEDRIRIDDRWHLGSCTKSMTATLAAVLVEDGKLSWDLTIAKALPELADAMHADYRDVTIESLLAMRGGVGHAEDVPGLWAELWQRKDAPVEERRKLATAILQRPPKMKAGEFLYSNSSFAIAGHMMETVLDEPWEQLLTRLVFEPLQMKSAGFGVPWTVTEGPSPHDRAGKPIDPGPMADNPPAIAPAATVHMTLADWATYGAEHLRGLRAMRGELLQPRSFARLHKSHSDDELEGYALGWAVTTRPWAKPARYRKGRCLTHTGSNNSWVAIVWIAPERDLAVFVATNIGGEGVPPRVEAVVDAVIRDHLTRTR